MKCKYFKEFVVCIVAAFIIYFLYYYTLVYCVEKDFKPTYCEYSTILQIDSLTKVAKTDTLDLTKFVARVDSIARETSDIRNRYQEDVNLMIYKSTHWITFWLGIFTVIAGFVGLLQYFRNRRYHEEFETLRSGIDIFKEKAEQNAKNDIKDYKETIAQLLGSYRETLENKVDTKFSVSDIKFTELEGKIQQLSKSIKKSESENRISTLMTCISSFPDPVMFNSTPQRNLYIQYYLKKLYQEFNEYIKIVSLIKKEDLTEDDVNRLSLALSSVKYVVVRTQSAYSGYHQNVTYNKLKDSINDMLIEIVEHGALDGDIGARLVGIGEMFKKMIHSIEVGNA